MPCRDGGPMMPNEHAVERMRVGLSEETPDLPYEVVNKRGKTIAAFAARKDAVTWSSNKKDHQVRRCP